MSQKKVSVVIPSYNSARFLPEAIRSIRAQSHKNLEIIIVDDGSTDDTAAVIAAFEDVRYIRLPTNNGGPAKPRNVGIRESTGEYIAMFDSDDVMLPGKIAEQVSFLDRHEDIPFVFTNFQNFDEHGPAASSFLSDHKDFRTCRKTALEKDWYRIPSAVAYETLIGDNFIGTPGVMIRRKLVDVVGFFDETLTRSEDIDYWFRIARRFDLGYIDRIFFHRRIHHSNISSESAALCNKLTIYERQRLQPLSETAERTLTKMKARLLFSIGYMKRQSGDRTSAIHFYLRSLGCNPSDYRIFKSILRAMLPI